MDHRDHLANLGGESPNIFAQKAWLDFHERVRRVFGYSSQQSRAWSWPSRIHQMTDKTALMFRKDLTAAGVPYPDDRDWRPHMTLEDLRPDDLDYDRRPEKPNRDWKTVPRNIERHVSFETRITAYRLKRAA